MKLKKKNDDVCASPKEASGGEALTYVQTAYRYPMVLAIIGFVLAVCGVKALFLEIAALCVGACALLVPLVRKTPREYIKTRIPVAVIAAVDIVFGLIFSISLLTAVGHLSVYVEGNDGYSPDSVTVQVKGTLSDGGTYNKEIEAKLGSEVALDGAKAGTYEFAIASAYLTYDGKVYKVASDTAESFDGKNDLTACITVGIDDEATAEKKAKEEADKKAAEEKKKQEEAAAAAKKQEEEAAAAKKQEEEKAAAAAAAAANESGSSSSSSVDPGSSNADERTVYITDKGKKYHRDGCRYLNKSKHPISLAQAKANGYEPCQTCNP